MFYVCYDDWIQRHKTLSVDDTAINTEHRKYVLASLQTTHVTSYLHTQQQQIHHHNATQVRRYTIY